MEEAADDKIHVSDTEVEAPISSRYDTYERKSASKKPCRCNRPSLAVRPLRVIEFVVVVSLLAVTIYTMTLKQRPLTNLAALLLMILFATYFFILGVDMISQLRSAAVPKIAMFLFATLGLILFVTAAEGVYIHSYVEKPHNGLLFIIALCVMAAVLFLVDFVVAILYWKRTCDRVTECLELASSRCDLNTIYKRDDFIPKACLRNTAIDVTTSISSYSRQSPTDLDNHHKYRKIGVANRREYVDCLTCVPSRSLLRVCETQTDPPIPKKVADRETLVIAEVTEEPTQTLAKCPMCTSNWEPQILTAGCHSGAFGLCPTLFQLARSCGVSGCQPAPAIARIQSAAAMKMDALVTAGTAVQGSRQGFCVTKIPK